jgi:solute carrier family 25 (mitochondrial thiamine pyrophosphate transporter), member 19
MEDEETLKSYPLWHNAVAGGTAGAGARLATAPLDLLRIRRQLESKVVYPRPSLYSQMVTIVESEGGFRALFRGTVAATYLWIGYSGVQFALYGSIQNFFKSRDDIDNPHPTLVAFMAGGVAGVVATWTTYPFDICRTIFAARGMSLHSMADPDPIQRPPSSLKEFALRLYQKRGIQGLYAGGFPATVQIMPYMGLNFAIYDILTRDDKRVFLSGMAGSLSGAVSKISVYPMDTVKKRLQAQAAFGPMMVGSSYSGMTDCITKIYRTEGVGAFYRGLVPSVLKTTTASGLSFALYRGTKNLLESIHDMWME